MEEAIRARKEGLKQFQNKDFKNALKFFEMSQQLYSTDITADLVLKSKSYLPEYSNVSDLNHISSSSSSPSSSTIHTNEQQNLSSFQTLFHGFQQKWISSYRNIILFISQIEEKYVLREFRPYVKGLIVIVILLCIFRLVFRQKISLGALPGDIYYQGSNIIISAPLVSCALVSFLLNAGLSLLRRQPIRSH